MTCAFALMMKLQRVESFTFLIRQYYVFNRYTSIGSIYDTVPNARLCISNPAASKNEYRPAYLLSDGRLERAGRVKKPIQVHGKASLKNGVDSLDTNRNSVPTASVIGVGDEILYVPFPVLLLLFQIFTLSFLF